MSERVPDWYGWIESPEAEEFRERIKAGEKGNRNNPMAASRIAFEAGRRRGKAEAADKLRRLIEEQP